MKVSQTRKNAGFTIIELLVVMAIIGVTLTIGLPSMQGIIANNRLSASANDMLTALQVARSESIKQVKLAGVTFINGGISWDAVVFDSPNVILQSYAAATNVAYTVTSGEQFARYRPDGRLVSNSSIILEFSVIGSTEKRLLTIKPSGTVSLEAI